MKPSISVRTSTRGTVVRATGSAAQALFDAMTKPAAAAPSEAEKPAITLTPCASEAVKGYHYDEASQVLSLQFKEGAAPYTYYGVPAQVYSDFLEAESKGRFVGQQLRGKYLKPADDADA